MHTSKKAKQQKEKESIKGIIIVSIVFIVGTLANNFIF